MKTLKFAVLTLLAGMLLTGTALSQTKTEETVTTTDSTGSTTTVKVVKVSETEDITPRNNVIVINPLKFFLFYNLSYYHAVSKNVAIGGGLQIPTLSDLDGFGVNVESRIHPSGKALRGFYIAPNVSYNYLSSGGDGVSAFSVGALVGWQWFPGDDFAIGLGIGADRYFISSDNEDEAPLFEDYEGTVPALRFDIGYGW